MEQGKNILPDARFDEAVNNLDPEAWRNLEEQGYIKQENVRILSNQSFTSSVNQRAQN